MREIHLIVHNVRSCHNVGSLLRTAEGLGITHIWLTGYTPYPLMEKDSRLPHLAHKIHKQIQKTALGAETSALWSRDEDVFRVITDLQAQGVRVYALEQHPNAKRLPDVQSESRALAVLVGREVEGVEPEVIESCDDCLEIPMFGQKESFNVAQAAAMALYHFRCIAV